MVVRQPRPGDRRHEGLAQLLRDNLGDALPDEGVGEQGHVRPMLFHRGELDDDGFEGVGERGLHLEPLHLFEQCGLGYIDNDQCSDLALNAEPRSSSSR